MSDQDNHESVRAAFDVAVQMRKAQREYFKDRDREVLQQSKRLERQFDLMAKAITDVGDLFGAAESKVCAYTVAGLPRLPPPDRTVVVTDALHQPLTSIVVGGGVLRAEVFHDGTLWRVRRYLEGKT